MKNVKNQLAVGDEVVCISHDELKSLGGSVGGAWTRISGIKVGDVGKVICASDRGSITVSDGGGLWLNPQHFVKKPDCIIILVRRPVDGKSIDKYLKSKGIGLSGEGDDRRDASRVRIVHLTGGFTDKSNYNGMTPFPRSAKDTLFNTKGFMKSHFGHKECLVIKTKPSVKKAIVELEKFI